MVMMGALIGAGTAARCHAEGVAQQPEPAFCYRWVWDMNGKASEELGRRFGISPAESLEQILDDGDVAFVDICTPTPTHREYVERAATAGKHVFCEKPIALTVPDAEAMLAACKKAGVKLGVGMVVRYFPEYRKIHEIIRKGTIGSVAVVHASRCATMPRGTGDWYRIPELSGGVLVDLLIHDIDFCRWCFGEVETVYCVGALERKDVPDYALVLLRFRSGTIAHLEGSWAEGAGFHTRFEAAGDSGLIEFDSRCVRALHVGRRRNHQEATVIVPESPGVSPYYLELADFVRMLRTGRPMAVEPEDAVAALRVALIAKRSCAEKRPIRLK